MALGTDNSEKTTFLQVDYGKKRLYIYSPTPKEGYEEHTSSKGDVTYRMYARYVSGDIVNSYFRDGRFGKEFVMVFQDMDEKYSVSMGIDSSMFTAVARTIANIDTSKKVSMSVYEGKGKNGKSYLNVSFTYPEELNSEGKPEFVQWDEPLPAPKVLASGKYNFTEAEEEAYLRADNFIKKNKFGGDNSSSQASSSQGNVTNVTTQSEATTPTASIDDLDELPF